MKKIFEIDPFVGGYQEDRILDFIREFIRERSSDKDSYIILEIIKK